MQDLKSGDIVELRNGRSVTIINTQHTQNKNYPICIDYGNDINYFTYTKKGEFISNKKSELDIVKKLHFKE